MEATLADVEAIKVLMARYFRFMDTKEWSALRGLLSADMAMSAPDDVQGSLPLVGADRVVRVIERVLGSAVSAHRGYAPEIEVTGPNEARAVWAMDDMVEFPASPERNFSGCGHYHAAYVRTAEGWRISSLTLRRIKLNRG